MDFNSLKDTVSNLSLYDLKAGVRKVQNGQSYDLKSMKPGAETEYSGYELH
jgi:hypothetical protein